MTLQKWITEHASNQEENQQNQSKFSQTSCYACIDKRLGCVILIISVTIATLLVQINSRNDLFEHWKISLLSQINHNNSDHISHTKHDFSHNMSKIINTSFTELSPEKLQTFQLQTMFRYQVNKSMEENTPITISLILETLTKLYTENNAQINFIQVGACDADFSGRGYQDIFQKYAFNNDIFYGILIEPVPSIFANLQKNVKKYLVPQNNTDRFVLLNAAFSASGIDENATFYKLNVDKFLEDTGNNIGYLHSWLYQLGSFSIEHIKKHLSWRHDLKHDLDYYIDHIIVDSLSANSIYNNIGKIKYDIFRRDDALDIIQIDAGGFDVHVVKGFIAQNILPLVLIYEVKHIDEDGVKNTTELLSKYGYINFQKGPNAHAIRFYDL
eukprot:249362_1